MPLYTYQCQFGHGASHLRRYAERDETAICCACGERMRRAELEVFAVGRAAPRGPRAQQSDHASGAVFRGCKFVDCGTAILAENSHIDAEDTTFIGNGKNVEAKNSVVRMRNTKSK